MNQSNLKYIIFLTFLYFGMPPHLQAKQIANWSSFYENGFIWNPALTARWTSTAVSLTHHKEWTGFEGAPQLSTLAVEVPFYKYGNLVRSSVGGYLEHDQVGPFRKTGVALTYGYHFTPQLFGHNEDYLSLGFGINTSRFKFDPSKLIAFDGVAIDPQLTENTVTAIRPNVNIGIYYKSTAYYDLETHYYIGLSVNQVLPGIIYKGLGLTSVPHATLHLGYRYFAERESQSYIEPNLMVIYAPTKAVHAMANIRYEMLNKFWLSGGAATSGELFMQAGLILDSESFLGSIVKDGALRVGAKADYMIGDFGRTAGIGYEVYLAYVFDRQ